MGGNITEVGAHGCRFTLLGRNQAIEMWVLSGMGGAIRWVTIPQPPGRLAVGRMCSAEGGAVWAVFGVTPSFPMTQDSAWRKKAGFSRHQTGVSWAETWVSWCEEPASRREEPV